MIAILAKLDNVNGVLENTVFPRLHSTTALVGRVLESLQRIETKWNVNSDYLIKEIEVSHITIQD